MCVDKQRDHFWAVVRAFRVDGSSMLLHESRPLTWETLDAIQQQFDVVHTHASKAGIIGRAAAWAAKVPAVIHTVHGPAFHRYEKAWKNRLYISAEKFTQQYVDSVKKNNRNKS